MSPTPATIYLHVQRFADLDPVRRTQLTSYLTPADLDGMARHPNSRERQMLARGLLREKLGEAAGRPPASLTFARDTQGKPYLLNADLRFNTSHSQAACALAWSHSPLDLGVDIEDLDRSFHEARLAEHAFSPGEIKAWQQASNPRQRWLCIWTRKESLLKATGLGIRISLASIDTEKGDPAGSFRHPQLGELLYRSWVASEQVFSLAWVAGLRSAEVKVSVTGSLPGFDRNPG